MKWYLIEWSYGSVADETNKFDRNNRNLSLHYGRSKESALNWLHKIDPKKPKKKDAYHYTGKVWEFDTEEDAMKKANRFGLPIINEKLLRGE